MTTEWQKKRNERQAAREAEEQKAKAEREAKAEAERKANAEQEEAERPINELDNIYIALIAAKGKARHDQSAISDDEFSVRGVGLLRDAMSRLPSDVARRLVDGLEDCDEKDVFEAILGGADDTELIPLFQEGVLDLAAQLVDSYILELDPSILNQQIEPEPEPEVVKNADQSSPTGQGNSQTDDRDSVVTRKDGDRSTMSKASFNARMIDKIQTSPESLDWSARKWVEFLGCSISTVHGQPTWTGLMKCREENRLAREMTSRKKTRVNRKPKLPD